MSHRLPASLFAHLKSYGHLRGRRRARELAEAGGALTARRACAVFAMVATAQSIFSPLMRWKCGPRRAEGESAPILECDLNPTRSIVA